MKSLGKVNRVDWDLVPVDPDPDFDPEHNKRVIAETIRKNDLLQKKRRADYNEKIDEKTADLAFYIKGIDQGGRTTDINKYFGKAHIAKMRGIEIRNQLMSQMTTEQMIKGLKNATESS